MPTIDQLDAVLATSDADELPVSQNGILRKVSRGQIVDGLQPAIALNAGQLMGRVSAGIGVPEPIGLGANLSIANGALTVSAALSPLASLPTGAAPQPADLVAMAQAGANATVSYALFMAGLGSLAGIDGSNLLVTAPGSTTARRLSDSLGDWVTAESFGAKGDGISNDTNAFASAIASGRPVALGPKTYLIDGQWTIAQRDTVLVGTSGRTSLRRRSQAGGGAWISVQAPGFVAKGIVFDANRATISQDSWNVLVTASCTSSEFTDCTFTNAGGNVLGTGLTFLASDPAPTDHRVRDCEFAGNAVHGLWVQACNGVSITGCRAHDNGQYGLCVDFNDATFRMKARHVEVIGCRAWSNVRGISVGNYNAVNTTPPVWGNANPDVIAISIVGNVCHDNAIYGIAAAGKNLLVGQNVLSANGVGAPNGAGLLANVSESLVTGNMIAGSSVFGIDCGGSASSEFRSNLVDGAQFGLNCGGSIALRICNNTVQNCPSWAIYANHVEADGTGQTFGISCTQLTISDNAISMSAPGAGGIALRDGPQSVLVARNSFAGTGGAVVDKCLCADTDQISVEGNRWNGTTRFTCNPAAASGMQRVVFPDIADTILVAASTGSVQSMVSSYQAATAGQLSFIRVTAAGAGYTRATLAIGGSGNGAQAAPVITGGAVIGIALTARGTGYGPIGATVPVTITGDGTGAAATGFVSAPMVEDRRLTVRCSAANVFSRAGSAPSQENWTQNDLIVPTNGEVGWAVTGGQWRATYATPSALAGCLGSTGHGSPEGILAAPPGSDYRNLEGGTGTTLFVKRTGTGPTGWFAVA